MKGRPKDWTLDELQTIWTFDGSDGSTITELADGMDISRATWYSIKGQLRAAGSPEALLEWMQKSRRGRYNRASEERDPRGGKSVTTVAEAMARIYTIRVGGSGRGGTTIQYTVTVPPSLAAPFVSQYGNDFRWEATDEGLLMRPIPAAPDKLPAWLEASGEGET